MLKFILIFLIMGPAGARAEAPAIKIKSWKEFKSAFGVTLKYPECWKVDLDSPDQEVTVENSQDLFFMETAKCAREVMHPNVPNGVAVRISTNLKALTPNDKEIKSMESWSPTSIARGDSLSFRKFKLGNAVALTYVETFKPESGIRWQTTIFCEKLRISLVGPHIKNPSIDLIKNTKAGTFVMPEPEKTLIESIRCP